MSAPTIPKLTNLRKGARGGARGGLSGRLSQVDKDAVVRSTDSDAASSRISAVEADYLDDPFAKHLTGESWQKRLPLMNRALDRIVDTFLSSTEGHKQIISLGAGSDTRYFRLKRDKKHDNFSYHELDFEENNKTKIGRLRTPQCLDTIKALCDVNLDDAGTYESELLSSEYSIHSIDLRKLPEKLDWLDGNTPTLLISECCLIYLSPDEADSVLSYFSSMLAAVPTAIAIYEPFRPNDPFGKTMIRNLTTRGIVLQTIEKYADPKSQQQRLADRNFTARVADTHFIWSNWIAETEQERIDKLEWMDEVEEFVLLAKHYCVAWGWRNYQDDVTWQALPSPA
ncbi:carboxy methyl transferase for protein phosphatase 2A [Exophiala xenobiotica]|nr:carboxy methyl transferase for protein phosphatase 2A [Exophiala xenobiotica]